MAESPAGKGRIESSREKIAMSQKKAENGSEVDFSPSRRARAKTPVAVAKQSKPAARQISPGNIPGKIIKKFMGV